MSGASGSAAAVDRIARRSYGRLLALLAAADGDIARAEDALADALETALRRWPVDGPPDNPDGWILTVARNRQRDVWRSAAHRTARPLDDAPPVPVGDLGDLDLDAVGDRRLELMLVCTHPAIDPAARAPLMLQTVLGFDAADVARVFAVPPATMAQRLVRAKRRIKVARVPFVVPDRAVLAERLPALLEAVYACLALSWGDDRDDRRSMAGEAQHLAFTLVGLLPNEPEAWALASLCTSTLARARPAGAPFVPLLDQDPADWDGDLADEAEAYLRRSSASTDDGAPGRFGLEAAISAVHLDRRRTGAVDWTALRLLYDALVTLAPSLGALVARAHVVGVVDGPAAGLAALDAVDAPTFQPWHATRATVLERLARTDEAGQAYRRAAELTDDERLATFLRQRADEVG